MRSYASALKLYNSLTKPPRSRWWREQPDNAKPLVKVRTRNKSIHMTDSGVIYFKYYNTKIASFVNDPASNTYTAVMRYYHSVTTNSFMSDYGLHYTSLHTDPLASAPAAALAAALTAAHSAALNAALAARHCSVVMRSRCRQNASTVSA